MHGPSVFSVCRSPDICNNYERKLFRLRPCVGLDLTYRQKNNPAALSRIRENQRRSRAQRRDYVKDLEKRLQQAESRDAQANIELQAAARKVAKENTLLKSLLRKIGVTDAAVADYLRVGGEPGALIEIPRANNTPLQSPTKYKLPDSWGELYKEPSNHSLDPAVKAPVQNASVKHPRPTSTTTTEASLQSRPHDPSGPPLQSFGLASPLQESIGVDNNDSEAPESEYGKSISNATSCETAARIIVSMRGYGNVEEIQSELGCAVRPDCMINNVDIFKIMER